MADRMLEGFVRLIDKRTAGSRAGAESMVDLGDASGVSGTAGEAPSCTVDGDSEADVWEPYGLAGQAAGGDALLLAPGGDIDNPVALLSSVAGRPATDTGDKALWCAGGHVVYLDNDGSLTITGKDGGEIEVTDTGKITINAAALASIEIYVGAGQTVKVGDALAVALTKWAPLLSALTAGLNAGIAFVGVPGDPAGENAGAALAAVLAAFNIAIAGDSPATTKAQGT
jgi:hypothetical protein